MGVVLTNHSQELACRFGRMDVAEPGLRVLLQLPERRPDARPVRLPHALIASYKHGQGYGVWCRKRHVPPAQFSTLVTSCPKRFS